MADDKKVDDAVDPQEAAQNGPRALGNMVRVCGKYQKKGYKPSKAEQAAYERKQEIRKANEQRLSKISGGKK